MKTLTFLFVLASFPVWSGENHPELTPEEEQIKQQAQEDASLSKQGIEEQDRDLWDTRDGEVEYDADDPGEEETRPDLNKDNL